MPKHRRGRPSPRKSEVAGKPYDPNYFARKHAISLSQARDLMRRIGNDRDKLNEAASKLFRTTDE